MADKDKKKKGISKETLGKIGKGLNYVSGVVSGVATANAGKQGTPSAQGGSSGKLKHRNTYDVNSFDEEDTENAAGK